MRSPWPLLACCLWAACAAPATEDTAYDPACAEHPLDPTCFTKDPAPVPNPPGKADAIEVWTNHWPGGDVYVVDSALGPISRAVVGLIQTRWAERTALRLHVVGSAAEAPGQHAIAMTGRWLWDGGVTSSIGNAAATVESSADSIAHELGHVLGFWHTQQRIDRDEHLIVHWPYISDFYKTQMNMVDPTTPHIGPYDIESIMQYQTQPLGHDWCCALSKRVQGHTDENECIGPFSNVTDWFRSDDIYIERHTWYSDLDYARMNVSYCDKRYCGERCAPDDRCTAPAVLESMELVYRWEASDEGKAWKAKYQPGLF